MSKETHRSGARPASTSYAEANPQLYSFLDWMAQQDGQYSQAFRQYAEAGTEEGRARGREAP